MNLCPRVSGQIVLRLDDEGIVLNRFLWGPGVDELVADEQVSDPEDPGEVLWALTDHLGTVRDLVRYDSEEVESVVHRVYDSFGIVTEDIRTEAVDVLFGFTGRPFDEVTGLQNNLNRWYDPQVGRWVSEDPVGFEGGDANLNRHIGNTSTNFLDPNGLSKVERWSFKFFKRFGGDDKKTKARIKQLNIERACRPGGDPSQFRDAQTQGADDAADDVNLLLDMYKQGIKPR